MIAVTHPLSLLSGLLGLCVEEVVIPLGQSRVLVALHLQVLHP